VTSDAELIQVRRRRKGEDLSIFSQLFHLLYFALRRPKMQLECGVLITSIDIDVGSRVVGELNRGGNDPNVHGYLTEYRVGQIEEEVIPSLIEFYDVMQIPVTFAVRGQLTEVKSVVLDRLLGSSVKHDIGAHGYSHRTFTSLSESEAQRELELVSRGMKKLGIEPKCFVFPKNQVAHLSTLEEFGYKCYREEGGLGRDGMYIEKRGQLYDVHPGFHLGVTFNPIFLDKIIDISAKRRLPFHIWFHARDILETRGSTRKIIGQVLHPIYSHAKRKERLGTIRFETMHSIAEKLETTN